MRCFDGGKRLNPDEIWQHYTAGKQTAKQLAQHFKCSRKTILRYLQKFEIKTDFPVPLKVNIVMDTTYFASSFGVMVLFDSLQKHTLWLEKVKYETNRGYQQAIYQLQEKSVKIQSIICDGRKGVAQLFPHIPVQLCQFHQIKTVIRYLTRKPKTSAGQALLALSLTLTNSSEIPFKTALETWYEEHKDYLNERTKNEETGKSHYIHKRLRSAYFSLKRNLSLLFTYESYPEIISPKQQICWKVALEI